jgi:hypothetical protein
VEFCGAKLQDKKMQSVFLSGMEAAAPQPSGDGGAPKKAKGVNYDY